MRSGLQLTLHLQLADRIDGSVVISHAARCNRANQSSPRNRCNVEIRSHKSRDESQLADVINLKSVSS